MFTSCRLGHKITEGEVWMKRKERIEKKKIRCTVVNHRMLRESTGERVNYVMKYFNRRAVRSPSDAHRNESSRLRPPISHCASPATLYFSPLGPGGPAELWRHQLGANRPEKHAGHDVQRCSRSRQREVSPGGGPEMPRQAICRHSAYRDFPKGHTARAGPPRVRLPCVGRPRSDSGARVSRFR